MNFICPICSSPLLLNGSGFKCENNHCFDRARQGYVNLLTHGGNHGDNRDMIRARRDFLLAGHYSPLAEALCDAAEEACKNRSEPIQIVDAGCGEGYYTAAVHERLKSRGIAHEIGGIDVSRDACALAARSLRDGKFAVASVYAMPFSDASTDIITSLFAPSAPEEYIRLLRPGGILIVALPGVRHLYGLKELLYDTPYENELADFEMNGFELIARKSISFELSLTNEEANALFAMTPYFYNTPDKGRIRLAECTSLTTEAAFELAVYKKL